MTLLNSCSSTFTAATTTAALLLKRMLSLLVLSLTVVLLVTTGGNYYSSPSSSASSPLGLVLVSAAETVGHSQTISSNNIHSLSRSLLFHQNDMRWTGTGTDARDTLAFSKRSSFFSSLSSSSSSSSSLSSANHGGTFALLAKQIQPSLGEKYLSLTAAAAAATRNPFGRRPFASLVMSIPSGGGASMDESEASVEEDENDDDDDDYDDEEEEEEQGDDEEEEENDSTTDSSDEDSSEDDSDDLSDTEDIIKKIVEDLDDNISDDETSSSDNDDGYDDYDMSESTDATDEEEQEQEQEDHDDDDEMAAMVEETNESNTKSVLSSSSSYEEPLSLSAIQDLGITLGVMVLCNKLDLTNAKIIRYARFAFIVYVLAVQLFVLYVRYRAQANHDTTVITVSNPLSSLLLQSQQSASSSSSSSDMVKNIANQLLSSTSTVMEYDLSQAKSMNSGLLFPMLMLWFLHFKMGQVQPLFFQTANGIKDFVMSPLFQVYVLGRNLERPFRNKKMEDLQKNQQQMMLGMQEGDENDQDGSNVVGEEMNESANDVNESEMESALNVDSEDDNDVDDDDDEYEESSEEDDYDDDTMKKIEKNEDS